MSPRTPRPAVKEFLAPGTGTAETCEVRKCTSGRSTIFGLCAANTKRPGQLRQGLFIYCRFNIYKLAIFTTRLLFTSVARSLYIIVRSLDMGVLGGEQLLDGQRQFFFQRFLISLLGRVLAAFGRLE